VGGILGSSLGGGLFGLGGLQNPLQGVSTGDTFYNKLFSLLFDGAVPVSTASIVLEPPITNPISTVLPPTSTVPAVALTPVITTTPFTGGGGGGGGGYTGGGGGISGGGFTGGGGGLIP
jgi:hypothetical protein